LRILGFCTHSSLQVLGYESASSHFLTKSLLFILSMSPKLTLLRQHVCFGGTLSFYSHWSESCRCTLNFSIYLPPDSTNHSALPVLYFLAGLTCTEENFMAKAGAQRYAAEHGLALVAPDTSPRNCGIPGEEDDWDFGTGAGFYVDATEAPWNAHYRMYTYVVEELPALVAENFNIDPTRQGICGHSMGGHGALVCGLRNRDRYRSISAFAPIAAPSQCPWGQKAFRNYLGENQVDWAAYDATELVKRMSEKPQTALHSAPQLPNLGGSEISKSPRMGDLGGECRVMDTSQISSKASTNELQPILIDQGLADSFLAEQLRPDLLVAACRQAGRTITYREQPQYDHSYYFIATFIEDHIRFHARHLNPLK
jgi:S-formylglutathione hydrolase